MKSEKPIPEEIALKLCEQERMRLKSNKLALFKKGQCWGCIKFSKDNLKNRCLFGKENNRGCQIVNKAYDKLKNKND